MGKKKAARTVTATIKTNTEAAVAVQRIGWLHRSIEDIERDMNDQIAVIQRAALAKALPLREELERAALDIFDFATTHRVALTADGKKTADLGTGTLSWRMTPPAVHIRNGDKVVEALTDLGLRRFIRVKREPDKEAMLKEPEVAARVPGVSIGQDEVFAIRPTELSVEIEATASGKIKIAKAA